MLADHAIQALDLQEMGFDESIMAAQEISERFGEELADVLDEMDRRDPRTCTADHDFTDGDLPSMARRWVMGDLYVNHAGLAHRGEFAAA